MTRMRIAVVLIGMLAAVAATLVAGPASAAPPGGPGGPVSCWFDYSAYTTATAVVATAYKDCTDSPTATELSVTLEIYVCDGLLHCMWASWKSGYGQISVACQPGQYDWFRSSRMRSKTLVCDI
jgi:hypothetical protein